MAGLFLATINGFLSVSNFYFGSLTTVLNPSLRLGNQTQFRVRLFAAPESSYEMQLFVCANLALCLIFLSLFSSQKRTPPK